MIGFCLYRPRWEIVFQLSCILDDGFEGWIHSPWGSSQAQIFEQADCEMKQTCVLVSCGKVYVLPARLLVMEGGCTWLKVTSEQHNSVCIPGKKHEKCLNQF